AGPFTFGVDFTADTAVTLVGVWWWQTANGPSSVTAYLWTGDGAAQLATGTNSNLSPGWNLVGYTTPYAVSAGATYTASVEIDAEHGYNLDGLPKTSPDGHVTLTQGRFESGHVGYPAANTWSGLHGIDLAYELAAAEVTGELDATLPRLTAQFTGSATAAASLAGTLPALSTSLAGGLTAAGALSGPLPGLSAHLAGAVTDETVRGDLAVSLPAFTSRLVADVATSGVLAGALPALTGLLREGRAVVRRPDAGTVTRPDAGTVTRPDTGIVPRP
ncbi:MAG: DUF4082 domain-containing protein, partial [Micromonosporaceae bacterium]|nr:DUF4082 domain-containing protein [Micromonosporaceae bacterium]